METKILRANVEIGGKVYDLIATWDVSCDDCALHGGRTMNISETSKCMNQHGCIKYGDPPQLGHFKAK